VLGWYDNLLLRPLGMRYTSDGSQGGRLSWAQAARFERGVYQTLGYDPWVPWGTAGRMYSCVQDMVQFIRAVCQDPTLSCGADVLRGVALARQPSTGLIAAPQSLLGPFRYGYAWETRQPGRARGTVCSKDGSLDGVSSYIAIDIPTDSAAPAFGLVFLLNMKGVPVVSEGEAMVLDLERLLFPPAPPSGSQSTT
jgi:hypothetical protein